MSQSLDSSPLTSKVYIVEHLDPELGPWSVLEYLAIAQESKEVGAIFYLSSISKDLQIPTEIQHAKDIIVDNRSVDAIFKTDRNRICLLDPAATADLSPSDANCFDFFLFGGILGA